MLRFSCRRLCTTIGAAVVRQQVATDAVSPLTLSDAFREVQQVWNIDFQNAPVTTNVLTFREKPDPAAPIFHVMDLDGTVHVGGTVPNRIERDEHGSESFHYTIADEASVISRPVAEHMLQTMIQHNQMDKILLEAQRQGRISFYMTMFGEEAAVIGAAAGLGATDELFMQYRESGMLTYRGYTIPQFIAQCMGNCEDDLKGRQMPIHYGSKKHHVQMISSPLGTQIPHGAGAGYAIRLENEALLKKSPAGTKMTDLPDARICATFFGEGAASEGDFHAGVNFAGVMGSHTLFFVRNNGYAISTPSHNQYKGDGILGRAAGYGIPAARVDGVDALAVYHTVRKAREMIMTLNTPCLVEALTYRISHHSTSDDSTAYRSRDELQHMADTFSPIERFEKFMVDRDWWNPERSARIQDETRKLVLSELRRQEKLPAWPVETMLDDVFEVKTPHLERQTAELMEHYSKYKPHYDQEKL